MSREVVAECDVSAEARSKNRRSAHPSNFARGKGTEKHSKQHRIEGLTLDQAIAAGTMRTAL